ncbi:unnamed protein product [Adineta steineri]|uniref:Letm1 RBD domain-containing protein n=1 Tax=Adineta steineri TaxID=433720 RepID=A0A814D6D1_9BILA|nr:unnamed protein product [Adineta steineri]CAF1441391.1 unnamed protein product [Adineta steineri]CAF1442434.1 unnamed protein product [Adineta steineri]
MNNLYLLNYSHHVIYSNFRLISSSLTPVKPTVISRIRYVLKHYWLGSKLLYNNYRAIQGIKKKDENSVTRIDKLSQEQFRYDIRVGIPFVTLFNIPILGYLAPLIALFAPKYLPSTLIMPTQQITFLKDDAKTSSSIIDSFMKFNKTQYNDETIYGMIPVIQFINQVTTSDDPYKIIISSIPEYSILFSKCYPLSSFSREHLLILHKSVLHSSFLARFFLSNYSLEAQLEMWQYKTLIDDKQIGNIDKLSPYELVSSLYKRGLYLHVNDMGTILENQQKNNLNKTNEIIEINQKILNDWKQLLYQWIDIHKKLSKYNPISTTFLLHISPLLVKQ